MLQYPLLSALSDFLWPRTCIYCMKECEKGFSLFCKSCFSEFSLVQPYDRCKYCYQLLPHESERPHKCISQLLPIEQIGFCFEKSPVIERFFSYCNEQIKKGHTRQVSQTIASFFVLQAYSLKIPVCDAIFLLHSSAETNMQHQFNKASFFHKKQVLIESLRLFQIFFDQQLQGFFFDTKLNLKELDAVLTYKSHKNLQSKQTNKKQYKALLLTESFPNFQLRTLQQSLSTIIENSFSCFYVLSLV